MYNILRYNSNNYIDHDNGPGSRRVRRPALWEESAKWFPWPDKYVCTAVRLAGGY